MNLNCDKCGIEEIEKFTGGSNYHSPTQNVDNKLANNMQAFVLSKKFRKWILLNVYSKAVYNQSSDGLKKLSLDAIEKVEAT